MKIKNKEIGNYKDVFLIGEIGSNHNQNKEIAFKLIDEVAKSGLDAVKFQTLKPTDIAKDDLPADSYGNNKFIGEKNYWKEVLEDIVLPFSWHKELFDYARDKNLIVLSTPESIEAVELLEKLDVPAYKIASMDITNIQLLKRIAKTNKPVILSSGIASIQDVSEAIDTLKNNGTKDIALLHCVSDYPPEYNYMSMDMIKKYKSCFDLPVGFSDHCEDNFLDGVAVSLGASIIEKHITLDKSLKGPDHEFALEPEDIKDFVKIVRNTEKALPINHKLEKKKEKKKKLYGRSIIIKNKKLKGEVVLEKDIEYKRPGTGILPKYADKIIGLELKNNVEKNHILQWDDFKNE